MGLLGHAWAKVLMQGRKRGLAWTCLGKGAYAVSRGGLA